jgi:hypothetical protein
LRQSYFNEGGRFAQGSPGAAQALEWAMKVDQHLRNACYNNDVGCSQTQQMYGYALLMLANERWERDQEVDELDEEIQYYDDRADEALDALKDCQNALASGQGCPAPPPPAPCPPCSPVVEARRQQRQLAQQQQGSTWGANLGWIAGGAVAGAGLMYFLRKR